ncbi:MAG: diacylglycerol kinase family lipid kinase [Clostridia bacterium]|nr:diacylglycerol kinase family lipid kinase [Clostridia bacterium]
MMLELIVNPMANSGKAMKAVGAVTARLDERGVEYRIHKTERAKDAEEIAKRLSEEDAETIVAVGGDGTIHEALNGMDCERVKLGIIPCGSGNDFAASAKIPLDAKAATDIIVDGEAKPTDYMTCGGKKGLNIIGTGIDVDILKRCRKSKILRGKLQYVVSLVISLIKFVFYKFYIIRGGEKEQTEALIACVGNGKQFGGGIRMCPKAEIDDGKLDFVIAGKLKKSRIPRAFIKLMKGKILEQDFTKFELVENVKIEFDKPVTVQIDGELYDGLDFDLRLVSGGIRIYRP